MELPNDRELECDVLGTLLRYNEHFTTYGDMLTPEMFYNDKCAAIFRSALDIVAHGSITDPNSIIQHMAAHSVLGVTREDVADVITHCAVYTLAQNIEALRALYRKRKTWEVLTHAAAQVIQPYTDINEEMEGVSRALALVNEDREGDGIASFADALSEMAQTVNDNLEGVQSFWPCGFKLLDDHYLLRPRSMTILAAFTSVGKSVLSMNIAMNVARNGFPVAIYSLEMGKSEIAARAAANITDISTGRILNARLADYEVEQVKRAMKELQGLPIYIDENGSSDWSRMMRSVRVMVAKKGVRLVVIDYLQIFTQTGDSGEASLSLYAREAKNIARELGIAVILVSQLNRSEKHPNIRMLRGSGQIEESADNVLLIDRPEAHPDGAMKYEGEYANEQIQGTAKFILAKGRNVGTGVALVGFDGKHVRFFERDGHGNELPFTPAADNDGQIDWNNITN